MVVVLCVFCFVHRQKVDPALVLFMKCGGGCAHGRGEVQLRLHRRFRRRRCSGNCLKNELLSAILAAQFVHRDVSLLASVAHTRNH